MAIKELTLVPKELAEKQVVITYIGQLTINEARTFYRRLDAFPGKDMEHLNFPGTTFYGIRKRNKVVCLLGMRLVGGSNLIAGLMTDPDYRGRNLARYLLLHIIEGGQRYHLRTDNPVAKHLYETLGFRTSDGEHYRYQKLRPVYRFPLVNVIYQPDGLRAL